MHNDLITARSAVVGNWEDTAGAGKHLIDDSEKRICRITCGALILSVMYQHSPWIHKQFYRGEVFLFSGTVYAEPEGSQASQLTDAMGKGNFHIILFKTQRCFMLDKRILKIKIHPISRLDLIAYVELKL